MQLFRKKYLYNPENPVFQNSNVKTFNCMDTQTKNNKLLLLQHLKSPPQVFPGTGILQPLQFPTEQEQFSVYPLVNCCSQIGKINQNDAMYVIKCLVQAKIKSPLYYVLSPNGICCSEVQGLLPNRSPDLFNLALSFLQIPTSLIQPQNSAISKNGYAICKAIRDGTIQLGSFSSYGWKDIKKQKDIIKDDAFWIFRGRRKEDSPFNEQYGLAWKSQYGLVRFKYFDLSKDTFEDQFQDDFNKRIQFYQVNQSNTIDLIKVFKFQKQTKGIKLFTQSPNQGYLQQYIAKRAELNKPLTESNSLNMLQNFIQTMIEITQKTPIKGHMALHIKCLHVDNGKIVIGQPVLITDKMQKKFRQMKKNMDYYAPQMKENILLPEKLFALSIQKMDIWSFGFLLHKIFTLQVPSFQNKTPIILKNKLSFGMAELIKKCLNFDPQLRPRWRQIDLRKVSKEQIVQEYIEPEITQSVKIRLDSPKKRDVASRKQKLSQKRQDQEKQVLMMSNKVMFQDEQAKIIPQQQEQQKMQLYLPPQISSKLRRIKLIIKIIIIMVMYIFVFFGPMLSHTIDMLVLRNVFQKTILSLVDTSNVVLSTTSILTNQPNYFLLNDISFSDVKNVYNCIDDNFDPINNPNYSLLTYIQSGDFLALILTSWAVIVIICVCKALTIWKGGIANRPKKNIKKYYIVYAFQELSISSLLFAHFFIYQFFYFASAKPCFSIELYQGVSPFFDSTLYLFLSNQNGYLQQIFATLGILSFILCVSVCFYSWGPKLDQKYFTSIPSITLRIIPYLLLILICRIGVFKLFSPTALNDPTEIISSILGTSAVGFFGIIPQVFVLICITIQVILEFLLYYCQQKAIQSDSLSKMFNLKDKKVIDRNNSGTVAFNEMSLQNSKQHLGNAQEW